MEKLKELKKELEELKKDPDFDQDSVRLIPDNEEYESGNIAYIE